MSQTQNVAIKSGNGVLRVRFPKSADAKERERRIPISG